MGELLFYALSAVAVLCALGVVLSRNPMQSVLNLLGSFVCIAVIYLLAGFQFLASAQILVYAGAIMVLFLFVVMLLNLTDSEEPGTAFLGLFSSKVLLGGLVGLGLFTAVFMATAPTPVEAEGATAAAAAIPAGGYDRLDQLAAVLFSDYMLAFEAASLLLFATIVGVMLLAKRQRTLTEEEIA